MKTKTRSDPKTADRETPAAGAESPRAESGEGESVTLSGQGGKGGRPSSHLAARREEGSSSRSRGRVRAL